MLKKERFACDAINSTLTMLKRETRNEKRKVSWQRKYNFFFIFLCINKNGFFISRQKRQIQLLLLLEIKIKAKLKSFQSSSSFNNFHSPQSSLISISIPIYSSIPLKLSLHLRFSIFLNPLFSHTSRNRCNYYYYQYHYSSDVM